MQTIRTSKILSLFLAVCMVFTMLPTVAFAETGDVDSGVPLGEDSIITDLAPLDENIAEQTVDMGTSEEELELPNELMVPVEEVATPQALGGMALKDETPLTYILSHGSGDLYSGYRLPIPGLDYESFPFRTLPQMIAIIREDSKGRDVKIHFSESITENGILNIGTGQAQFINSGSETWGHITFTGVIRSNSAGWATVYLNGVSAEIQAEILNEDGSALSVGNSSMVEISNGRVYTNKSHPAYAAVNIFDNSSVSITGGKVWATFGGTPVHIADGSRVTISGTPEVKAKDNTQEAVVMKTADCLLTLGGSPEILGTISTWVGKLQVPLTPDGFNPGQKRYTLTLKGTPGVSAGNVAVDNGKKFIRNFKLTNENLYLTTSTSSLDLLVTNEQPSSPDYVITGSNGNFSATYGGFEDVPNATGTLDAVIHGIGVDAMGEPCAIWFGGSSTTLDIGTETATFANDSELTWGELTLYGKVTSASSSATVRVDGITLSTNADIANSGSGDGIDLGPKKGTLNITRGNVSATNGSAVSNIPPGAFAVNSVINISGTAVLSSANYQAPVNELEGGTLYVKTGTTVNISNATILNTAGGNAIFSNGNIALSGSPDISGPIRIYTPQSKMSVDNSFVPSSKSYPLTVYELSGDILNKVVVDGGAAFINNFPLTNKGYELAVSENNLVVNSATKKISLTPAANKNFGSATVGYEAPTTHSVTVSNTGNEATGDLTIALSGADATSFILSKTAITSLAKDSTDSFTIVPKTGLLKGTYNATVTISGDANIIAQSFVVTFNVIENGTNPTTIEITGFKAIPDENVGKAGSTICANAAEVISILPTSITATYASGSVSWPVTTWVDTDNYDPAAAGSYTFTATLAILPGFANSAGHTCTVEVVVAPADSTTTYTVTFNANDGTGTMSPQSFTEGVAQNLATNTFTRTDYSFAGWNTLADGIGGTSYADGASYTATANTTLYAQWTKDSGGAATYIVTVNGSYTSTTGAGSYAKDTTVNIYAGNRSNYTFTSWTSSDVTITDASSKDASFAMPGKAVTVTANWSYNGGGGSGGGNGGGSVSGGGSSSSGGSTPPATTTTPPVVTPNKQDAPDFTDIGSHWAKDDIQFVVNRGLLSGTSATIFSPNTVMTRGMFVTALGRLANADISVYKQSSFTDVKNDAYYMGYIEWASKNKIVNGIGDEKFAPDQSITREQMAVIMQNYTKAINLTLSEVHAENTFADSTKISTYAKSAVKTMQMAGIISGKTGNIFDPQGSATRAEVSAVLHRLVELAKME